MDPDGTENLIPDPSKAGDAGCCVELRAARIPVVGWFAHHHWFVVERNGGRDRWEIWQFACAGGTAWGHLHRNLLPPERGVGNGPSWVIQTWTAAPGHELAALIEASPQTYPYQDRYLPWPGPNSNTYVQWILGDRFQLGRKAVGCAYAARLWNRDRGESPEGDLHRRKPFDSAQGSRS